MSIPEKETTQPSSGYFQRTLDLIEFIGNKFPTPFMLFALLAVAVLIVSFLLEGTSAAYVGREGKQVVVKVTSLMNANGFRYILEDMIKNFINFPPLGLVVVMMLAMGLAESTGFVSAVVRKALLGVPPGLLPQPFSLSASMEI